ncbi:carboxypeptidase regulatory-like domain-containing protein [Candidatus Poribacteria bacterium]|nr:carboxypeptidase regulatory-like domain-containing protein [Candidatus Poribacteria bacterium]
MKKFYILIGILIVVICGAVLFLLPSDVLTEPIKVYKTVGQLPKLKAEAPVAKSQGGHFHTDGNPLHYAQYSKVLKAHENKTERLYANYESIQKRFPELGQGSRSRTAPVAHGTVTIMSGPRFGECVATDQHGQYVFPGVSTDKLRLLVEKQGFEPKEVIVHRNRPTTLSNGISPNFHGDPQKTPGNILIGRAWPDEVRFIFKETQVVLDLLYIEGGVPSEDIGGFYGAGMIVVYSEHVGRFHGKPGILGTFAHEIAHAHQHALISIDGSGDIWKWKDTPEGQAFADARRKD